MLFVRFISQTLGHFKILMPMQGEAMIACSKKEDPITTANVYLISEYDKLDLIANLNKAGSNISIQVVDTKSLRKGFSYSPDFPEFRNDILNLSEKDIEVRNSQCSFNILILDALGINATDMTMRSSAWRAVARKIQRDDVSVRISISSSIPFAKNAPISLSSGFPETVLFGPIPLQRVLDFDFIINSPKLGSLDYSRKNSYEAQVNEFICNSWHIDKLEDPSFRAELENEELFCELIKDKHIDGQKPSILINAISDLTLSQIPKSIITSLISHIKQHTDTQVLVTGFDGDLGSDAINLTGKVKSLQMLNAVVKVVDAVISCDGPAISMSMGQNKPSVFMSTSTKPEFINNRNECVDSVLVYDISNVKNLNRPSESERNDIMKSWDDVDLDAVLVSLLKKMK